MGSCAGERRQHLVLAGDAGPAQVLRGQVVRARQGTLMREGSELALQYLNALQDKPSTENEHQDYLTAEVKMLQIAYWSLLPGD